MDLPNERLFLSLGLEVTTPIGRYLEARSEGDAPAEYGHSRIQYPRETHFPKSSIRLVQMGSTMLAEVPAEGEGGK